MVMHDISSHTVICDAEMRIFCSNIMLPLCEIQRIIFRPDPNMLCVDLFIALYRKNTFWGKFILR
jgi:hypothetical protein